MEASGAGGGEGEVAVVPAVSGSGGEIDVLAASGSSDPQIRSRKNRTALRERVEQMQSEATVQEEEEKLRELVEEAMRAAEGDQPPEMPFIGDAAASDSARKPGANESAEQKRFYARESLLTEMLKIQHFRTLYNIFIVMLVILLLNTAIYDYVVDGSFYIGAKTVYYNFGAFRLVLFLWLLQQVACTQLYQWFIYWAALYLRWNDNPYLLAFLNYTCVFLFVLYQLICLTWPAFIAYVLVLPPVSAMIMLIEQVRIVMKTHSFVRRNIPRVLNFKELAKKNIKPVPHFRRYLYFLYAPTLLYRDNYPKTKRVNWLFVAWRLAEVVAVVFFVSFLFERCLVPSFRDFGKETPTAGDLVVALFSSMFPSLCVLLSCFYCILHAWHNAFAEGLCFADRMFYKDWWNANSYSTYHRWWNVMVHDWLHEYVYQDLNTLLRGRCRPLVTIFTFLLSAVVHEYIITFMFGFFYPVLFLAFGVVSVGLVFVTHDRMRGGNLLMWLLISIGMGLLVSLYLMEWYARQHCPSKVTPFWDFFIPRSWFCFPKPINTTMEAVNTTMGDFNTTFEDFTTIETITTTLEAVNSTL